MTIDAKKIALLHVAKKQLALTDEHWHDLLARTAGVESSKDCDNFGFQRICEALQVLGWQSHFSRRHGGNLRHWSKITVGQSAKIDALWRELHGGELDEAARNRWLARFGADAIQFFDRDQARKAVAALLSWRRRVAAREAS